MLFSQRNGLSPLPDALKPDAMPSALRNSLWNAYLHWNRSFSDAEYLSALWIGFYKQPIDTIPAKETYHGVSYQPAHQFLRENFFKRQWNGVYDFLEFCMGMGYSGEDLAQKVDTIMEKELAAYRVIERRFVQVTDNLEVEALETALSSGSDKYSGATRHISTALALLSRRDNPDYRNSIKESISAVEAAAKVVSGKEKATLHDALTALGKSGKLHGALQKGYSSLYAYTNDADGIRHALMDEPNLTAADAKYFLLSCVSFVNYLKTLNA